MSPLLRFMCLMNSEQPSKRAITNNIINTIILKPQYKREKEREKKNKHVHRRNIVIIQNYLFITYLIKKSVCSARVMLPTAATIVQCDHKYIGHCYFDACLKTTATRCR